MRSQVMGHVHHHTFVKKRFQNPSDRQYHNITIDSFVIHFAHDATAIVECTYQSTGNSSNLPLASVLTAISDL
jgi:hypothetical protein